MLDRVGAPDLTDAAAAGGEPVSFAGCLGFLHGAPGAVGVLMVPPWGFEELTVRKSWRLLAEQLGAAGYPALRFDLPGTANSLGAQTAITSLDPWRHAIGEAAALLRARMGCRGIVVLGQGLGALLALDTSARLDGIAGAVAMAPMAPGRMGVRELELWGAMLAAAHNIPADRGEGEALSVAGFAMSQGLVDALKALDPRKAALPAGLPVLLVVRSERPADADLGERLGGAGARVDVLPYDGYEALVSDPTAARPPRETFRAVAEWLGRTVPAAPAPAEPAARPTPARISGEGFDEEVVRFGPQERLFGVLTRPLGQARGSVVFLNAGYNPQAGWARMSTDQARALALRGYASLRFDTADIGDSPSRPGIPEIVLYSPEQTRDVSAALDLLARHGHERPVLVGRCSGAYMALHAARDDERTGGVVAVNPLRLVWVPGESVAEAIRHSYRSLGNYRARLLQRDTWREIVGGEVDLLRVGRSVLSRLARRAAVKLAPVAGPLTAQGRLLAFVRGMFARFAERRMPVTLVYAEGDGGLDELALYFGTGGRRLAAYPNVVQRLVPGADHNMTPHHARAAVMAAILATLEHVPLV